MTLSRMNAIDSIFNEIKQITLSHQPQLNFIDTDILPFITSFHANKNVDENTKITHLNTLKDVCLQLKESLLLNTPWEIKLRTHWVTLIPAMPSNLSEIGEKLTRFSNEINIVIYEHKIINLVSNTSNEARIIKIKNEILNSNVKLSWKFSALCALFLIFSHVKNLSDKKIIAAIELAWDKGFTQESSENYSLLNLLDTIANIEPSNITLKSYIHDFRFIDDYIIPAITKTYKSKNLVMNIKISCVNMLISVCRSLGTALILNKHKVCPTVQEWEVINKEWGGNLLRITMQQPLLNTFKEELSTFCQFICQSIETMVENINLQSAILSLHTHHPISSLIIKISNEIDAANIDLEMKKATLSSLYNLLSLIGFETPISDNDVLQLTTAYGTGFTRHMDSNKQLVTRLETLEQNYYQQLFNADGTLKLSAYDPGEPPKADLKDHENVFHDYYIINAVNYLVSRITIANNLIDILKREVTYYFQSLVGAATISYDANDGIDSENKESLIILTLVNLDLYLAINKGTLTNLNLRELLATSFFSAYKVYDDHQANDDIIANAAGTTRQYLSKLTENFLTKIDFTVWILPESDTYKKYQDMVRSKEPNSAASLYQNMSHAIMNEVHNRIMAKIHGLFSQIQRSIKHNISPSNINNAYEPIFYQQITSSYTNINNTFSDEWLENVNMYPLERLRVTSILLREAVNIFLSFNKLAQDALNVLKKIKSPCPALANCIASHYDEFSQQGFITVDAGREIYIKFFDKLNALALEMGKNNNNNLVNPTNNHRFLSSVCTLFSHFNTLPPKHEVTENLEKILAENVNYKIEIMPEVTSNTFTP